MEPRNPWRFERYPRPPYPPNFIPCRTGLQRPPCFSNPRGYRFFRPPPPFPPPPGFEFDPHSQTDYHPYYYPHSYFPEHIGREEQQEYWSSIVNNANINNASQNQETEDFSLDSPLNFQPPYPRMPANYPRMPYNHHSHNYYTYPYHPHSYNSSYRGPGHQYCVVPCVPFHVVPPTITPQQAPPVSNPSTSPPSSLVSNPSNSPPSPEISNTSNSPPSPPISNPDAEPSPIPNPDTVPPPTSNQGDVPPSTLSPIIVPSPTSISNPKSVLPPPHLLPLPPPPPKPLEIPPIPPPSSPPTPKTVAPPSNTISKASQTQSLSLSCVTEKSSKDPKDQKNVSSSTISKKSFSISIPPLTKFLAVYNQQSPPSPPSPPSPLSPIIEPPTKSPNSSNPGNLAAVVVTEDSLDLVSQSSLTSNITCASPMYSSPSSPTPTIVLMQAALEVIPPKSFLPDKASQYSKKQLSPTIIKSTTSLKNKAGNDESFDVNSQSRTSQWIRSEFSHRKKQHFVEVTPSYMLPCSSHNSTSATDQSTTGSCAEEKEDSCVSIVEIKTQESNQLTRNSHVNKGVLCNNENSHKNENERQHSENCVEESSVSEHSSNLTDCDFDKMLKDIEIVNEKHIEPLKFRSTNQDDDEVYSPSDIELECEMPLTPVVHHHVEHDINENHVELENVNSVPEVSKEDDQLKLSSVEKEVDDHANNSGKNNNEDGLMDFHMFFDNIIHWSRSEVFPKLLFQNLNSA